LSNWGANQVPVDETTSDRELRPASSGRERQLKPAWHRIPTAIARRFHQICAAKTAEVVSPAGLTPLQYGAMLHLSKTAGTPGIDQIGLAERINIDRNTASLLVEELVRKGLVERQVNGADRRSRVLSLTAKGEALYLRLRPAHAALNKEILAPITAREQKLLMNLLVRVVEGNLSRQNGGSGQRTRGARRKRADA
jgi:DNA-binding MarR family transcriptional regulator